MIYIKDVEPKYYIWNGKKKSMALYRCKICGKEYIRQKTKNIPEQV